MDMKARLLQNFWQLDYGNVWIGCYWLFKLVYYSVWRAVTDVWTPGLLQCMTDRVWSWNNWFITIYDRPVQKSEQLVYYNMWLDCYRSMNNRYVTMYDWIVTEVWTTGLLQRMTGSLLKCEQLLYCNVWLTVTEVWTTCLLQCMTDSCRSLNNWFITMYNWPLQNLNNWCITMFDWILTEVWTTALLKYMAVL